MVITLYGPDSYRRKIKLDSIVSEYKRRSKNAIFGLFDFSSPDEEVSKNTLKELSEFLGTPSLFESAKLVVLKDPLGFEETKFKQLLKNCEADTTIIISDSVKTIKKEFGFLKDKPNLCQFFDKLDSGSLNFFIKEEAKKRGVELEAAAVNFLAAASQGESWDIINELDKLKFVGSKKPVSVDTLKKAGIRLKEDFFGMVFGWLSKPVREKLCVLERLFALKTEEQKIFNILAYQDVSKLRRFADYDVLIKSGKLECEDVLLDLALL